MQVLVFKTNLTNPQRINDVEPDLNVHSGIHRWNVDLNDCDYILRIESNSIKPEEVEQIVLGAGYYCEELQ